MTSWIWSVPEEEWPLVKRDEEMLRSSVAAQLDALELTRQCETFCKGLQAACDDLEREQKETASTLTSLSEDLTSLERQLGIWTDLTSVAGVASVVGVAENEPEAKIPRIILQDPCVSSTERNSVSPHRSSSTEFYEISDDVIVISESQGWEEKGSTLVSEMDYEEERNCMTIAMATEMLDQEEKKEIGEMMGEDEKEEEETQEREDKEDREEEIEETEETEDDCRSLPSRTGQRVVARKSSETWWAKGKLMKVTKNKFGQVVYRIQFDKGDKGLIHPHLIASNSHPRDGDLQVGSRVVGVYAKWNKLYGGIVAEAACDTNRNRYLVFYDDGFAQYMSNEELHEVIMPSTQVWKDVAAHSRDFIKEYLETFPMRPLLEVKVGDKVNTEWRRTWSLATVDCVDCSLVKMKFNSAREEWIYRGSPRLEPLYRFLECIDEERDVWVFKKGRDSVPTLKELLSAHQFPCYVGDHAITCPSVGSSPPDDDITIVCVKDGQGRVHNEAMKPPQTQGGVFSDSSIVGPASSQQVEQLRPLARKSTSKQQTVKRTHSTSKLMPMPSTKLNISNTTGSGTDDKTVELKGGGNCDGLSSGQWEAPWLNLHLKRNHANNRALVHPSPEKLRVRQSGKCVKDIASCLLRKLGEDSVGWSDKKVCGPVQTEKMRNTWSSLARQQAVQYFRHECSASCSQPKELLPDQRRLLNPLSIPLLLGWQREILRRLHPYRMDAFYRSPSPCSRRLRCMAEVVDYLYQTGVEDLSVDQFTFDTSVSLSTNPVIPYGEPNVYIEDLSGNLEPKPISCVNEVDSEHPPPVDYISRCLCDGVNVNVDSTFLVCCDCTDDCQDKESCACFQLTREAAEAVGVDCDLLEVGYTYRRIESAHRTAIYECNSRCKCSSHCANRVVQNGIQVRLQVFKTPKKGWGVHCLDDLPKGSFVCCYAGQLLTEDDANKEGHRRGDEYIAELDHIEVAEKMKEGYESDVSDLSSSPQSSMCEGDGLSPSGGQEAANSNRREDDENMMVLSHLAAPVWCRVALNISDNNVEKAAEWLKLNSAYLPAESMSDSTSVTESSPSDSAAASSGRATTGIWSLCSNSESVDSPSTSNTTEKARSPAAELSGDRLDGYRVNVKATSGRGRSCSRSTSVDSRNREKMDSIVRPAVSRTRSLFDDLGCYAVDAKSIGNVGRYLNHSCSPNLFVQNVFVDTHDLRFPCVAFFSKHTIKAMTELTWDYNYEVGSVPGRELTCYCGTEHCRGRLL